MCTLFDSDAQVTISNTSTLTIRYSTLVMITVVGSGAGAGAGGGGAGAGTRARSVPSDLVLIRLRWHVFKLNIRFRFLLNALQSRRMFHSAFHSQILRHYKRSRLNSISKRLPRCRARFSDSRCIPRLRRCSSLHSANLEDTIRIFPRITSSASVSFPRHTPGSHCNPAMGTRTHTHFSINQLSKPAQCPTIGS